MLIVHCGHHRCGTVWFDRLFRRLAKATGLAYARGDHEHLRDGPVDILLDDHSSVAPARLPPFRGSHIRRDPRDVLVSCYFYHLWADEPWLQEPRERHGGRSHQAALQAATRDEGLLLELEASAGHQIAGMMAWALARHDFLEVTYEELVSDEAGAFARLFAHWDLEGDVRDAAWHAVALTRFERQTGRKLGEAAERRHMRSGLPGQWQEVLGPAHLQALDVRFPGYLEVLGYR